MSMRAGLRVIGLVNTIILARLLMPEDFGLVAMASLCLGLLETGSSTTWSNAVLPTIRGYYGAIVWIL